MLRILGTVNEGEVPMFRDRRQLVQQLASSRAAEFAAVSLGELIPAAGIAAEEVPELLLGPRSFSH